MVIIVMGVAIVILFIFTLLLSDMIKNLTKQLVEIDKEQHTQNKEIMDLMKHQAEHQEMLLQHIEILKYLIEQDPKLSSGKMYYTGPIGEA